MTPVKVGTNDPCYLRKEEIYRGTDGRSSKVLSELENKIESLKIWKVKSYRRYPLDRDERNEKLRKRMCWIKKVKVFSSCSAVK